MANDGTPVRRKKNRGGSPEVKAMQGVYKALKPLSSDQRVRVLNAVNVLIAEPAVEAAQQTT